MENKKKHLVKKIAIILCCLLGAAAVYGIAVLIIGAKLAEALQNF